MKKLRVAVLMGGPSPERDVSVSTGRQIVTALDPQRYNVLPVEITKEGKWLPRPDMLELPAGGGSKSRGAPAGAIVQGRSADIAPTTHENFVEREQVDVAFIAMHGPFGEDGTMQGLLELLGIPY
ncbi:MAG: D-alanine--D-alanine ligase A, partial [bacterium]